MPIKKPRRLKNRKRERLQRICEQLEPRMLLASDTVPAWLASPDYWHNGWDMTQQQRSAYIAEQAPGFQEPAGPRRVAAATDESGNELVVQPSAEFYEQFSQGNESLGDDAPEESDYFSDSNETGSSDDDELSLAILEEETFRLHSWPSATKTIYLDFDGHTTEGTTWNAGSGITSIVSPAYDPSGNGAEFTSTELTRIQQIWKRVAEDFAPFDINVTTEEPPVEDLLNSGGGDERWGTRVVTTIDWNDCSCGGFAYLRSFDDGDDEPVFVFNRGEIGVSAAISHEVGHALGLRHDGLVGKNARTYYGGHGSGDTSWGPIMGSGYTANLTTWDAGHYSNTSNTTQNDFDVMQTYGFGYRDDDHGGDAGSASEIDIIGESTTVPLQVDVGGFGVIERADDADLFEFVTGDGPVSFFVDSYVQETFVSDVAGYTRKIEPTPSFQGTNLDVTAAILDENLNVVASSNNPTGLNASLADINLTRGRYYLSVQPEGVGDWTVEPPEGYDSYVSRGQYQVSGTIWEADPPSTPIDFERVEPFGSLISQSVDNTDTYEIPDEKRRFEFYAEAGEVISANATSSDASSILSIEVVGVSAAPIDSNPGETVQLPPTVIPADGFYHIAVSTDVPSDVTLDAYRNAAVEIGGADTSLAAGLPIDDAAIDFGGLRYNAIGEISATDDGVDEFTVDLTSQVGQSIDVSLSGRDADFSGATLELVDPLGAVTAVAVAGTDDVYDLGIRAAPITAIADNVYTVRVTAPLGLGVYGLMISGASEIETQTNDAATDDGVIDLTVSREATGHLSADDTADLFSVSVSAGDVLLARTETFLDQIEATPLNQLNPSFQILGSDGATVLVDSTLSTDGKNEFASFNSPVDQTIYLSVQSDFGVGDYRLILDEAAEPFSSGEWLVEGPVDYLGSGPDGLSGAVVSDLDYDSLSGTVTASIIDEGILYQPAASVTYWDVISREPVGDVVIDQSDTIIGQSTRYTIGETGTSFHKSVWDQGGSLIAETSLPLTRITGTVLTPGTGNSLTLNALDPDRLLIGMSDGIYRSTDGGLTVTTISEVPATPSNHGDALAFGGVSEDITNPNVIYFGDTSGNIHVRSAPDGDFDTYAVSDSAITTVMLDPVDWKTALATDQDQVFYGYDAGERWSDITGNLATAGPGETAVGGIQSMQYVTGDIEAIVVGTDSGIYASLRSSLGAWFKLGESSPSAAVLDLDYDATDDVLVAGTAGEGVWMLQNVQSILKTVSPVQTSVAVSQTGNLQIQKVAGDAPSNLVLQADVANSRFVISGENETLSTSVFGSTGNGSNSVTIPFNQILGSSVYVDLQGGGDSLTIDYDLGEFPKRVYFNGGSVFQGRGSSLFMTGGGAYDGATIDVTGANAAEISVSDNLLLTVTNVASVVSDADLGVVNFDFTEETQNLSMSPTGPLLEEIHIGSSFAPNFSIAMPSEILNVVGGQANRGRLDVIGPYHVDETSVLLAAGEVTLDQVNLDAAGDAEIALSGDRNVAIESTALSTVDGDITISSSGQTLGQSGSFDGILVVGSTILTDTGNTILTGRSAAANNTDFQRGVLVFGSTIESTGIGSNVGQIAINGVGGNGHARNYGVEIGLSSTVRTVDAPISIDGQGGSGTSIENDGVVIDSAWIESTGVGADAGNIAIVGVGGNSSDQNIGIRLQSSTFLSTVQSVDGDVVLLGTGGGTGVANHGVEINDNVTIQTTGGTQDAGNVTIIGYGAAGDSGNRGIDLDGENALIQTVEGAIRFDGIGGNGLGGLNYGVHMNSGTITTPGAGGVSVTGLAGGTDGEGLILQNGAVIESTGEGRLHITAAGKGGVPSLNVSTGSAESMIGSPTATGDLELRSNSLSFDGLMELQGSGDLIITPQQGFPSIGIGGGAGELNIDDDVIAKISDQFQSISIGNQSFGGGDIDIDTANFNADISIFGGSITVDQIDAAGHQIKLVSRDGAITNSTSDPNAAGSDTTLSGIISPGEPGGVLAIDGGVRITEDSTLTIELRGTNPGATSGGYDQIRTSGDLVLEDNITLDLEAVGQAVRGVQRGQTFMIAELTSPDASVTGQFAGLADGTVLNNFFGSGFDATIDYQGGDGNDVVIEVTPEPSLLAGVVINDGYGDSRSQLTSLTVTFNEIVNPFELQNAFTVTNIDTGEEVTSLQVNQPTMIDGQMVVRLTFGSGTSVEDRDGTGMRGNSLMDGNYRLTIDANHVISGNTGETMDEDYIFGGKTAADADDVDRFFRLLGDVNGDGFRNGIDLQATVSTFFNPDNYQDDLDVNGDGVSNGIDLQGLVSKFYGEARQ